jgi:hypothetical protein
LLYNGRRKQREAFYFRGGSRDGWKEFGEDGRFFGGGDALCRGGLYAEQSTRIVAECFGKLCDSGVYRAAQQYCRHPACPVPCAVLKAIEAACGLALPRDVEIRIENQ